MPAMDGLAATEAVRAARMDVRVVLLTASATTPREAGVAGADAVVPKSARPAALLRTLATSGTGCPYCL
jgi:CheY-like chemotaxis protein